MIDAVKREYVVSIIIGITDAYFEVYGPKDAEPILWLVTDRVDRLLGSRSYYNVMDGFPRELELTIEMLEKRFCER